MGSENERSGMPDEDAGGILLHTVIMDMINMWNRGVKHSAGAMVSGR